MWIVRLALRRPYTFVVMATLMLILGGIAMLVMPTDIFPYINIPVVSIVWSYPGVSPDEMEKRIVTVSERAVTTTEGSARLELENSRRPSRESFCECANAMRGCSTGRWITRVGS